MEAAWWWQGPQLCNKYVQSNNLNTWEQIKGSEGDHDGAAVVSPVVEVAAPVRVRVDGVEGLVVLVAVTIIIGGIILRRFGSG